MASVSPEAKARERAYKREIYQLHKTLGWCHRCLQDNPTRYSRCLRCRRIEAAQERIRHAKKKAQRAA